MSASRPRQSAPPPPRGNRVVVQAPPPTPAEAFAAGKPRRNTPLARLGRAVRGFLVQNNLLGMVQRNLRFTLFLTVVAMFYVWNSHQATKQARAASLLERDLKELKSEYHTLSAQLSTARQQSQIAPRVIDSLDLKPLEQPPFKLKVNASEVPNE